MKEKGKTCLTVEDGCSFVVMPPTSIRHQAARERVRRHNSVDGFLDFSEYTCFHYSLGSHSILKMGLNVVVRTYSPLASP
eukprot:scaffold8211_cov117-Cylindrotheca_fusiformis.AAC.7